MPYLSTLLFLLLALPGLAMAAGQVARAPAAPAGPLVQVAQPGELHLALQLDVLETLRLSIAGKAAPTREVLLRLYPDPPLWVELGDGAPTGLDRGALAVADFVLVRADGRRSPPLWLHPAGAAGSSVHDGALAMDLRDAGGRVWMRIVQPMRSPAPLDGLRFFTADLRVGPALAAWAGGGEGLLLGNVALQVPLMLGADATRAAPKSCPSPNWPGTPGYVTDVHLHAIPRVDVMRCRVLGDARDTCGSVPAHTCDGPGGSEGEVVITPSATLRNRSGTDAADVPWYRKFTGPLPPYDNDQHPYLVWNLYRLDADGTLSQIGRSGLKHAFATANTQCDEGADCPTNGNILGPGCRDVYNAGSNDLYNPTSTASMNALAPRAEIIPSTGQWGRCGSEFDTDCDGQYDAPPAQDCRYRHRLVARESAIDPAEHPGARWFVDAWYVVRDDVDIFNTMGFVEIHPTWLADSTIPRWNAGSLGAFAQGPVLDLWHELAPEGSSSQRSVLETADGSLLLVSRVQPVDGGYRYQYALMNFDFSRATTAGAEPDLQILDSSGLGAVRLSVAGQGAGTAAAALDGARDGDEAWLRRGGCAGPSWVAPQAGADLRWGALMHFTVHSVHPPVAGELLVTPSDPEAPAPLSLDAFVPDAGTIFCDPFE